ncbi:hypothetical protein EYC80_000666 [Monilinia laxa]|uniref:Indoleamine 2,3-dioxygenase n=1 Tax=Monilinia laxa TaxID=61186 RepID=A0A5N6KBJ7_MONLA|nr:hypothetical protein EYC80_000666 [Monilinia laxa]
MSDVIQSSEEVFFRMFYDLEVAALPIYHSMILSIHSYPTSRTTTLHHLRTLTTQLRPLLQIFYTNLTPHHISPTIWLSYIQGFQGWGVGKHDPQTGAYTKYDGLSGNHVLVFQALDAFLGMDRYLTDENTRRCMPVRQRELCEALRRWSFVGRAKREGEADIVGEVEGVVRLLKVFRAAHRARVMGYLREPAPERLLMTAGKSVLGDGGVDEGGIGLDEALKPLDEMLVGRLTETGRVLVEIHSYSILTYSNPNP